MIAVNLFDLAGQSIYNKAIPHKINQWGGYMSNTFVVVKKQHVIAALAAFAVFLALSAFAANVDFSQTEPTAAEPEAHTLVIDAGHGGIDGGAIGADGSKESDINLAISLRLQAVASFCGKNAVMTRVDDSRGANALTYSEHDELVYRADVVNSTPNAVLLSIHQNCYPTAQPSGAQVLYSANGKSESFGVLTHTNLINTLDPQNRRVAEPDKNHLYILSNVQCPAILVECGFVSNHSDITKLTDSRYQTALSTVLMASYLQFIKTNIQT